MTYFHGSPNKFETPNGYFCVTDSADVAREYVFESNTDGYLYTIEIPQLTIADESDLRDAAQAVDVDDDGYVFDLVDSPKVRAELTVRGFAGVAYKDISPNNVTEHQTVALFDGSQAIITNCQEISEDEDDG